MTAVSIRALATHQARQRQQAYASERAERMRGYRIEWAHAEALREQRARDRTGMLFHRWDALLRRLAS